MELTRFYKVFRLVFSCWKWKSFTRALEGLSGVGIWGFRPGGLGLGSDFSGFRALWYQIIEGPRVMVRDQHEIRVITASRFILSPSGRGKSGGAWGLGRGRRAVGVLESIFCEAQVPLNPKPSKVTLQCGLVLAKWEGKQPSKARLACPRCESINPRKP